MVNLSWTVYHLCNSDYIDVRVNKCVSKQLENFPQRWTIDHVTNGTPGTEINLHSIVNAMVEFFMLWGSHFYTIQLETISH